jgi:ADP-ribose pyrophosphatase YjhB (NUDIX family)
LLLLKHGLYRVLRKSVGYSFNFLNICLVGNLPPQGCVSVIVEDQSKYLLLRRPKGTLVFPGGFMRWREHPTQTAVREFKEETGLWVQLHHVVACYSTTSKNFGSMSTLTLVFCGKVIGGKMRDGVEGQPCWLDEANLLEIADFRNKYMLDDFIEHLKQHDSQEFCGLLLRETVEENL